MAVRYEHVDARGALNPTGGFLGGTPDAPGYTHSFNPATGCAFAPGLCGGFCYAREFAERRLGAGAWGSRVLVKRNAPELLARELARAARRDPAHRHHVARLSVFSASVTEPCVGPVLEVYRECLRALAPFPIARWVVQTRSPRVLELEPEIRALGDRVVVSVSLETDDEDLWRAGPPGAPGIAARRRTIEALAAWGMRLHVAVSPCLPVRDPVAFADWIAAHATDATVDTPATGDGSGGRRTARGGLPAFLAERGVDWRDLEAPRALLARLAERMGERAGWSDAGFLRLAR
jgi:DNA repair photolyase